MNFSPTHPNIGGEGAGQKYQSNMIYKPKKENISRLYYINLTFTQSSQNIYIPPFTTLPFTPFYSLCWSMAFLNADIPSGNTETHEMDRDFNSLCVNRNAAAHALLTDVMKP